MYGPAGGGQVGSDALGIPALRMQRDDRVARRGWVCHLLVVREAAGRACSWWSFRQHPPDRTWAGATAEVQIADGGDLVGSESRVVGLEVYDELAHIWWQGWPGRAFHILIDEEAHHAQLVEPLHPMVERAPCHAGLQRPFSGGLAEEHYRTQDLIADLLRPRHPRAQSRELALSFQALLHVHGWPTVLKYTS